MFQLLGHAICSSVLLTAAHIWPGSFWPIMTEGGPSSVIRALSFSSFGLCSQCVSTTLPCRRQSRTAVAISPFRRIVSPNSRDDRRSKRQTHWVSRPIRITACCLWLLRYVVRSTAVLPFLRLQFCWRGLYSRRVPRTSAIPSSGPPCEPTISSAPAGALSRRMPRRRT